MRKDDKGSSYKQVWGHASMEMQSGTDSFAYYFINIINNICLWEDIEHCCHHISLASSNPFCLSMNITLIPG